MSEVPVELQQEGRHMCDVELHQVSWDWPSSTETNERSEKVRKPSSNKAENPQSDQTTKGAMATLTILECSSNMKRNGAKIF